MKRFKKIISIFFLLIPPLILPLYIFNLEYQKFGYSGLEIKGGFMEPKRFQDILANATDSYEIDKKNFQLNLPKEIEAAEFIDFKNEIKKTFISKLGIFSLLPIYSLCLKNNNIVSSESQNIDTKRIDIGATGIIFEKNDEYNLFARVSKKDCNYVFKNKITEDKFRLEHRYAILYEIGPDDQKNILEGKPYSIYVREFKIDASNSYFVIKLSIWVLFLSYFLLLVAWSYVFFQFKKIKDYVMKSMVSLREVKNGF